MLTNTLNVRAYSNKQVLLFPATIGDFLPEDDLAHVVDDAVGEIDLKPYSEKISQVGNPSYHPALMIKIWFYGYATRTYSSRKIEEKLFKDVAFIFLAGMQRPDFKTISEFRKNNLEELKKTFIDILQICHRLGMTKLGEISIDSKVMKANAAARRTYDEKEIVEEREKLEKAIEEYLKEANNIDCKEDEKYGSERRGNELPEDIRKRETRIRKMKHIMEKLKQAEEKLKKSDKKKINITDEDAQFQKDGARIIPGYREQVAVDSKEQIIVANDVTNNASDATQLLTMVEKVCENVEELSKGSEGEEKDKLKIMADSGYNSELNLAELEKKEGIDVYMADRKEAAKRKGHKTIEDSLFHMSKFTFKEEDNCFICPAGKKLNQVKHLKYRDRMFSLYKCKECSDCQYFGECTKDKTGRNIWLSEYAHLTIKMRQKLSTEEGKKIYKIRRITVEPVLGNLSQNLGFREFLLRGLQKVKGEFSLMCIAHNLLKIARCVRRLGVNLKEALNMPKNIPVMNTP